MTNADDSIPWVQHYGDTADCDDISETITSIAECHSAADVLQLLPYLKKSLLHKPVLDRLMVSVSKLQRVIHPLVLSVDACTTRAELVDGHHRLYVASKVGLLHVPLLVERYGDPGWEALDVDDGQPYCGSWG